MHRAIGTATCAAALALTGVVVATPASAAPPSNDSFANATVITGSSGSISGTNVDATGESGESQSAGSGPLRTVWYAWTAPASGSTVFDTCTATTFDTILAVYPASSFAIGSRITYNDDTAGCGTGAQSRVTFTAVAGTTYKIQVDGYNGASGSFTLSWAGAAPPPPAPPNDNFVDAQPITGESGAITGTTVGATGEPGEPRVGLSSGVHSVWYRWTAPSSGTATFDLCTATTFDTLLGVYTGDAVNQLAIVVQNDDDPADCGTGLQSLATFQAVAGTEYKIQVDGYNGAAGAFTLSWDLAAALPTVSVSDASTSEGDEGTSAINFPVTLSEPAAGSVTVDWTTADGTAVAPQDYVAESGTVTFAPGETLTTIDVAVVGDLAPEDDETFTVTLSNPTGAELGDAVASGTIVNDDVAEALADLGVSMTQSPESVEVGQDVTYTIQVTNDGPSTATGVEVTDELPADVLLVSAQADQGTCELDQPVVCVIGDLASGATATITIVVTPTRTGTLVNTATASAAEPDPDETDNKASVDTTVTPDGDGCTILGTDEPDAIAGTNGDDVICGGDGEDLILGGGGRDTIRGGDGSDILQGGSGGDVLDGGAGFDDLRGQGGKDVMIGGAGFDTLNGGGNVDVISYVDDPAGVSVSLQDDTATDGWGNEDTLVSVDVVRGSAFGDILAGSRAQDELFGNAGDDMLSGQLRNDLLNGGAGFDVLNGDGGKDVCRFGEELTSCEF